MGYRNIRPSIRKQVGTQGDATQKLYDVKEDLADATYEVGRAKKFTKAGGRFKRIGQYLRIEGLRDEYTEKQHSEALKGLSLLESMYADGGNNWYRSLLGGDEPDLLDYYLGASSLGSTYVRKGG